MNLRVLMLCALVATGCAAESADEDLGAEDGTPNTGETNFGVFNYYGQAKPAASALKSFIASH